MNREKQKKERKNEKTNILQSLKIQNERWSDARAYFLSHKTIFCSNLIYEQAQMHIFNKHVRINNIQISM